MARQSPVIQTKQVERAWGKVVVVVASAVKWLSEQLELPEVQCLSLPRVQ